MSMPKHVLPTQCPICHSADTFTNTRVPIADGSIFICATCSGYFLWPPVTVEYTNSGWSQKRNADWQNNVKLGMKLAPRIRARAQAILERPIETVLEIGCSTGYMASGFVESGCIYTGIDVDASSIEFAKRHSVDAHDIRIEDIANEDSPLAGQKFDLVISSNVFEHVDDPVKALEMANLVCGGIVIIIVPNPRGLYQVLKANKVMLRLIQLILGNKREIAYSIDGYWHNIAYNKNTLKFLAQGAGLEFIDLTAIGINDEVFGYVQPLDSPLIRIAADFAHLLKMDSQLMLIAKASTD